MILPWHTEPLEQIFAELKSSPNGLSSTSVHERQKSYGLNRLSGKRSFPWLRLLWRQMATPFVLILLVASLVKYFTGGWIEGSVILFTLLLMILIGFVQEMKAEKTLAALKKLSAHRSKVKRDGNWHVMLSEQLVPGDVILIERGDKIPADSRLIDVTGLKINESILTGESAPLEKTADLLPEKTPLAERRNMVYSDTVAVDGKGEAIVVATGMQTEVGKIAQIIQDISTESTPLEKDLHSIGRWMIVLIVGSILLFAVLGFLAGISLADIFLLSVAATVSAVPEGLPAAFAVTLAVGMHIMSRRNAIVRKMSAVETLGSTTVICSDKTGTLTCNEMTVVSLYVAGQMYSLPDEKKLYSSNRECKLAFDIAILCNDSQIVKKKKSVQFLGDPTETSLVTAAVQMGADVETLYVSQPRLGEIPFRSEIFYMATFHTVEDKGMLYLKGAPEKVLALANRMLGPNGVVHLDEQARTELKEKIHAMTQNALRVIGVAYLDLTSPISLPIQESVFAEKLIFVGLFGMKDPPRKEAIEAIALCKRAQIRVIMMTGDNSRTAEAIAKQLAIPTGGVLEGKDLHEMDPTQLATALEDVSIFARVEPSHKLQIVHALRAKGEVVAVTGDGINDAPALQAANIGIAMGLSGSDVAKEAADIVLMDDRFDSIIAAIEEGRAIFNRLRNICALLLTTCFGEIIGLLLCVGFLQLAPLIPSQILWLNLVAGSIIAIPLGLELKTGREMDAPPRNPKSRLIYTGMLYRVLYISLLLGLSTFFLLNYLLSILPLAKARSIIFTATIVFEWVTAVEMRSPEIPSWKLHFFKNVQLMAILGIVALAHLSILYIPALQFLFETMPLTLSEWALAFLPAGALFVLESLRKALFPQLFRVR